MIAPDTISIHGGTPVIQRELNRYKGASVIGEEEKRAVMEVLDTTIINVALESLRYWSVTRQEAYASADHSTRRALGGM